MADLDDFFAKKDKKKGGKKTTKYAAYMLEWVLVSPDRLEASMVIDSTFLLASRTATSDVTAKSTGAGSTKVVGTNIKPSILKVS
jgi:hypothetical protein